MKIDTNDNAHIPCGGTAYIVGVGTTGCEIVAAYNAKKNQHGADGGICEFDAFDTAVGSAGTSASSATLATPLPRQSPPFAPAGLALVLSRSRSRTHVLEFSDTTGEADGVPRTHARRRIRHRHGDSRLSKVISPAKCHPEIQEPVFRQYAELMFLGLHWFLDRRIAIITLGTR